MLKSEKLIVDPHPDQHQKLTTSRGSPLAHAYYVWSTCVNAFASYLAHRMADRMTDETNTQQRSRTIPESGFK